MNSDAQQSNITKQYYIHLPLWLFAAVFQIWRYYDDFVSWETFVTLLFALGLGGFCADFLYVIKNLIKRVFELLKMPEDTIASTNEFVSWMISFVTAFWFQGWMVEEHGYISTFRKLVLMFD